MEFVRVVFVIVLRPQGAKLHGVDRLVVVHRAQSQLRQAQRRRQGKDGEKSRHEPAFHEAGRP